MSNSTRAIFTKICTRAVTLTNVPPCIDNVRYVSSISSSLVSLASYNVDTQLLQYANTCVQRLTSLISHLPITQTLSDDVTVSILRIVKSGSRGCISSICMRNLLMELDERTIDAQFALWKPSMVLVSLHALAKAAPTEPLEIIDTLLYCAKEHLLQLDEPKTARLLWSIATLRMEMKHTSLWKATCRRLIYFSSNLTASSRSLVVEALIIVPECVCDAQQELLSVLQETRLAGRDGDNFLGSEEELLLGKDYKSLKDRLLSDAHLLPAESIIRMLSRTHSASSVDTDEVDFLLQHILRRQQLGEDLCHELIKFVVTLEPSEVTRSIRRHILNCIRANCLDRLCAKDALLSSLGTVCIATVLEKEDSTTHEVSRETQLLLEELISKCHEIRDLVWERYNGKLAGLLSVALDILDSCNENIRDTVLFAEITRLLEEFTASWERGNPGSVVVTECTGCLCSVCDLLRISPLLRLSLTSSSLSSSSSPSSLNTTTTSTNTIKMMTAVGEGGIYTRTCGLLQSCTLSLERCTSSLSPAVVFDLWRRTPRLVADGGFGNVLLPLTELLLNYAEQNPAQFSLREMTKFMRSDSHEFPVEAFEIFVRCLMNESDSVTSLHLEVLLTALETVAAQRGIKEETSAATPAPTTVGSVSTTGGGGGNKLFLERLLLLLFIRPLGHKKALVYVAAFSTPQLVRLYQCCNIVSDVIVSMQATLLELIVNSCVRCTTMAELNTAASLLPQLSPGGLKNALACALAQRAKTMNVASTPDLHKALLVVYFNKAAIPLDEELLKALRRRV
ncbi:uncharacterized protein TM35_000142820 [Trypanosoma theileri]|uniref:Uncharacterized protein n=1 Tax=Trypanosoma theileri TaxID=67003 RepID=A0A1X0NWT8_9TRYP|nr:uncharacterized protein TM35_000142820 [Trypanosoma theileri]ORC89071.1 hypothetical protein TM35_000142820 [Trypanosoma theileri]